MPCFPKRKISLWIKRIAEKHRKRVGEVSYIFCSDSKIMEINKSYLNHDYYTDIITFDYTENDLISGDIFISVDTVRSNAAKYGVVFDNELFRVIIHGILHLCGIDDKAPGARIIMEKHEDDALRILNDIDLS
jgi:rRNA maturation RNase YbeY